jgi:ATP-dependent Lon protease
LRGGLKTVLFPKENEKDLAEIPDNVKRGLTLIPVNSLDELLHHALVRDLVPIEWTEESERTVMPPPVAEDRPGIVTH